MYLPTLSTSYACGDLTGAYIILWLCSLLLLQHLYIIIFFINCKEGDVKTCRRETRACNDNNNNNNNNDSNLYLYFFLSQTSPKARQQQRCWREKCVRWRCRARGFSARSRERFLRPCGPISFGFARTDVLIRRPSVRPSVIDAFHTRARAERRRRTTIALPAACLLPSVSFRRPWRFVLRTR